MHIAYTIWALLAAWKWADWRNWKDYHATMLYMPLMNLLYMFLCSRYLLWKVNPEFGISYALIEIMYTFIIFPATVILFLSNYPETRLKIIIHNIKWIFIYIGSEFIGSLFGRIEYQHGWSIGWSLGFLSFMFPMIRLHYKHPVIAYIISIIIIVVLLSIFDVPVDRSAERRLLTV
ncbi:CBO0543 family protein [Alkalihalobacillus sp. AL-G]|uniref:CBO0543 family protein n=1 Tax=Alkalihalobacillus sp. AL-G TaxID=2926399 RepID=UPI00272DC41A|nr:CBO0543 family protein [Alkalihalobacillus sp. AL-G]WLD92765.1 hypothetical protein MOJ78_17405 [Alkalihalobacillus sp. AL-G]